MALDQKKDAYGYSLLNTDGTYSPYEGYVQSRMPCFNSDHIHVFMMTCELSRRYNNNNNWRMWLNEWFYKVNYASSTISLLTSSDKSISEIAYEVGFTSPSYFSKCYKEYFGVNPTESLKKKNG